MAVIAILALGLLPGVLGLKNPFRSETKTHDQSALLVDLRDVSRYEAATGQFQVLIDTEKDTRYIPSVIKGERVTFIAEGDVNAVVDFSSLNLGAVKVSDDRKSVSIELPEPVLSPPRIDPDKSRVLSRKRGLLDRVGGALSGNPTNEQPLYQAANDKLAAAAAKSELVARAEQNTRKMLDGLLSQLGYADVTITFAAPADP